MRITRRPAPVAAVFIKKVANAAARLALPAPADGDLAFQVDNDTLYQYESGTTTWEPIANSSTVFAVSDTDTMDLTIASNTLSAALKISAASPDASYKAVTLVAEIDGLRAQVADEDIQDAAYSAITDTDSIDLTYNDALNQFYADLRLSANAAQAGYVLVTLSIKSTGSVGLHAELQQSAVDHGSIGGLADDDHTQYARLQGRSGGQILQGGTGSGEGLTIQSTANATKGKVFFGNAGAAMTLDEVNARLGLGGITAPNTTLDVLGNVALRMNANSMNNTISNLADDGYSFTLFNGTTVTLDSLAGGVQGKIKIIINGTGGQMTVKNEGAGTAANRIVTGTGADIIMGNGAALFLMYDSTNSRWRVIGGAGGGGFLVNATQTVADGTTITVGAGQRQVVKVDGSGGPITASAVTGLTAGTIDGQEVRLVGQSDSNTVTLTDAGNVRLNGSCTLGQYDVLDLFWDASASLWIESSRSE